LILEFARATVASSPRHESLVREVRRAAPCRCDGGSVNASPTVGAERRAHGSARSPLRGHGDGEKLRSFYAKLFGWAIDAGNPLGYGVVQRETNFEGVGIGGGIGGMPEGTPGHVTFYVEVPDVEAALARAQIGGTRVMGPSEVQPGVELGQFSDPEGHMVGLLKGPA
jgi:uncharacterized protein